VCVCCIDRRSRSRNRSSVAVKPLLGPHNQSISQLTPPGLIYTSCDRCISSCCVCRFYLPLPALHASLSLHWPQMVAPADGERESGMVRATQASFWPQSKFGALKRTHSDVNAIGGGDGASASSSASGSAVPGVSASSSSSTAAAPTATAAGNDAAASSTPSDDSAAAPQVGKGSITEDPVAVSV